MIPRIFGSTASDFATNGVGALLNLISCEVKEEINGAYELNATILTKDKRMDHVRVGNIITAKPNMTDPVQAFVIESVEKGINNEAIIYATHISQHRTKLIPVSPFTANSLSEALRAIKTNSLEDNPFSFSTNKTVSTAFSFDVPRSVRSLMGGEEGSLLDVYRGEYYFNNFNIELLTRRGTDSGVRIMYGENMTDFTSGEGFDWDSTITGVVPYWRGEESVVIGDVQYSSLASNFAYHKTITMDFTDRFQEAPSKSELNAYALNWITSKGNPSLTLSVAFDQYGLTSKQVNSLSLGDTVHVIHNLYNTHYDARIVSITFDVLAEKYTELQIGSLSANLNDAVSSVAGSMSITNDAIDKLESNKVNRSGDTMTGQLKTSYKNSVAMGSYGTSQTTVDGFINEVRFSSGAMGSISINTAYGIIPTGWYNFIWSPHRTGGMNGNADGDNCNYGNLLLLGMNNTNGIYRVRVSGASIQQVERLDNQSVIKGIQTVVMQSDSAIANGSEVTLSKDFTAVSGATKYYAFPSYVNFGYCRSVSISNNTLTIILHNASGASHTMATTMLVIAI